MQSNILVTMLLNMNILPDLVELCKKFLTGRVQCITMNDVTSDVLVMSVGCPQGAIAGPLFRVAYVNSLQPTQPVSTVIYADDMYLMVSLVMYWNLPWIC